MGKLLDKKVLAALVALFLTILGAYGITLPDSETPPVEQEAPTPQLPNQA